MSIRCLFKTALFFSAVFVYSTASYAQAPIVDASVPSNVEESAPAPQAVGQQNTNPQGELFYQLQLLQQEVMQLRGQVEEQAYELQKVKEQNRERYIDLDRRIGELSVTPVATTSPPAAAANQQVANLPVAAVPSTADEREAYNAAYSLVVSKQFADALNAFKQFLIDYPDGRYAPNSHYWMGELYQVVVPRDLDASREAFTQLLNQYPNHAKVPDAMYKLGKVYFEKGDRATAKQWLERLITEHGQGANRSAADKARQFINANF